MTESLTAASPIEKTDVLLDAGEVRITFDTEGGPVTAVDGVSLRIRRGRITGLVGESGSGKSITARALMRMVPEPGRTEGGSVRFAGTDLLTLPEREMRAIRGDRIAMVFQDPQASLNPVLTVGQQVAEALIVHGERRAKATQRAVELLDMVGIPDPERRAGEYPHQFSGGMRQRVVIAMALARDPDLLIADEPTTALDVTIQAQILRLLAELRERTGVAVLMITHDMGVVAELCDEVAVMYGGRIVETGTAETVFTAPAHPYTRALLRAMPRLDSPAGGRLPAIPGQPPDPANLPTGCAFNPRCVLAHDRCRAEIPVLDVLPADPEHRAACWATADGRAAAPAEARADAAAEAAAPERPAIGETILEVDDLRVDLGTRRAFGRGGSLYIVDGVSLRVAAGETLGLVGESGCGKSTLARTLVGINRPAAGTVRIRGLDVATLPRREAAEARRGVQYVFQDPYASLNPRRTVRQVLDEALGVRGVPAAERAERAAELLDLVGLGERHLDRLPHAFSGGQRQRIGIARALAVEPECLVLDEPVSALDVSIQAQIMNLLADLRDRLGLGYLFIAHDLAVVRHISDRVAVMYLGRIVETGPAERLYADPQHPYTVSLLSSVPTPEAGAGRERIVLRGDLPSPKNPPSGCRFRTRCPIGPLARPERTICAERDPALSAQGPAEHGAACHFPGELRLATQD
ncbi:dipeptide ABC transporter ATP-binding protein [Streptomyces acidicola]|uniref:ABC transporter ATP-binding protein n=1 Tax=Streptomyces acidicola TaxID=2596892 RepID=A0A5N8X860_9ACTN|nr:ABC transporter ATP-binding protein [Streptomyces acidicola]MPY55386.1 ABC transporter ATP-binding protein [Streptomyces acidicola]